MASGGLIVRNARLHPTTASDSALRDVLVDGDAIAAIRPAGTVPADGRDELDAEGRLLSPPLVDPHVHMDAVLTVGEPRHNESGTLIEGIQTWAERKPFLTHEDVKRRALEAIRWEVAQGTGLIRSHVDVCDPNLVALKALIELRDEVRDIVDLRLIAFPQDGILSFPNGKELMREAMRLGCDVIGGIPHYEWTRDDGVEEVHFIFDLAKETGAPIDLHCDETDDEQSRFLEVVAARRDARRDAGPRRRRAHDRVRQLQRRLRLQAAPDPQARRRHDRRQPARQHRPPGPLRHLPEAARHDPRQGARRGRRQRRLRPRLDHGSLVPARARLDARRAVDARPRRPDDRPERAVPRLRDGHDQPGPGGRGPVGGEGGPAGELRGLRLRRTRRRRSACGRRPAGSSGSGGSWPRRSRRGA